MTKVEKKKRKITTTKPTQNCKGTNQKLTLCWGGGGGGGEECRLIIKSKNPNNKATDQKLNLCLHIVCVLSIILFVLNSNICWLAYYICMPVDLERERERERVCVCVCVRARVRECVRVAGCL